MQSKPKDMAFVPAGTFIMGTPNEVKVIDSDYDELTDTHPAVEVYLDSYYIDKYPVTNKQYQRFINATDFPAPGAYFNGWQNEFKKYGDTKSDSPHFFWNPITKKYKKGFGDYPVINVSWYEALAYSEWVGKRLPTEAEWEKAARGTDDRPYPWGWDDNFSKYGDFNVDFPQKYSPVQKYPLSQSPFGCYRMLGGIDEWCSDWYSDERLHFSSNNPQGPLNSTGRKVIRGGWLFPLHLCMRDRREPLGVLNIGFRCALSANLLNCEAHKKKVVGHTPTFWCARCGRRVKYKRPTYMKDIQ